MWADTLREIVAFYASASAPADPTFLYNAEPPRPTEWPPSLPSCEGLRKFYSICGRGEIGPMIRFLPVDEVASKTSQWIDSLRDYDARGDVLYPGRHVVFGNDADGSPWVWDAATGCVASFYWKGGDWEEPRFASFDDFMDNVLSPRPDDPSWTRALKIFAAWATRKPPGQLPDDRVQL